MSAAYRSMIRSLDKLVPARYGPFWNHEAGPKTIFFWAPTVKWALVIAGIGDLARPADKLSVRQCAALAATGTIWARYCLVIIPKNYYLCSVNVFVGATGLIQLFRIFRFNQELKKKEALEQV